MNIRVNVDRRRTVSRAALLAGLGLGSIAAYVLDPDRGKRRRALVRDRAVRLVHAGRDVADKAARDIEHRAGGMVASMQRGADCPSADVLVARVRSELGRAVSHPHAIEVLADDEGRVLLRGVVLEREVPRLLSHVRKVRGVCSIVSELEAHGSADVPSLQGGPARVGARPKVLRQTWAPSVRVGAAGLGALLSLVGLSRRGLGGLAATFAGAGLLARSITNLPTKRLLGIGAGARAVDVHKTIHFAAPIDDVFALWTDVEAFPRVFEHVKDVRITGDGRSHWVVSGPAGVPVRFDAEITRFEPGRVIGWKTFDHGAVEHAGIIHFEPEDDGTRVDIQMTYNPAAGALGHAVASLFGVDPKHAMDADLVRLKSLLELGKTRAHGARIERSIENELDRAMQ